MPRCLLAAEVDQIQDFVFRSSRLREVVGGSQLLSRFCGEGAAELLKQGRYGGDSAKDIIVNDGGAFRIEFNDEQTANDFGHDLAELYRRCAGGNLTVAKPVPFSGDFQKANEDAQRELRNAKSRGDVPATAVHLPYLAFCVSCGVAVATTRGRRPNERENYYCASCLQKERERNVDFKRPREENDRSGFLGMFHQAVSQACRSEGVVDDPGDFPKDADEVAAFDLTGRRYVAYLLADGNGMGKLFSKCPNKETMKRLSQGLSSVLRVSLAAPCPNLLRRIDPENDKRIIPVLPLILGGDDLFALLPASWAIDFAARFCRQYEERLKVELRELHKIGFPQMDYGPTIAAAVVICKGSYPHTLAHKQGEGLLKEAKRLARTLETTPDPNKRAQVSVLNFALITGNEVGSGDYGTSSAYRPTARPYLVDDSIGDQLKRAGISIQSFLDLRLRLAQADLPSKRRAEFERLYDDAALMLRLEELEQHWKPRLDALLNRIRRIKGASRDALEDALRKLGDEDKPDIGFWRNFVPRATREGSFNGHGLPDLLAVWDYAYDLTKDQSEYEPIG
jgi:hypothetical protein